MPKTKITYRSYPKDYDQAHMKFAYFSYSQSEYQNTQLTLYNYMFAGNIATATQAHTNNSKVTRMYDRDVF